MKKLTLLSLFVFFLSCKNDQSNQEKKVVKYNTLQELLEGNRRFSKGQPIHPDESLERIQVLKSGQHPKVVVVSCSDSRVPPELIFDQGLGDIFSIRTAGNIIGDYEMGSIEYAVEHLNVSLVLVMGHDDCGAIKAFWGHKPQNEHIQHLVEYIAAEKEQKNLLPTTLHEAVKQNVLHAMHSIPKESKIISNLVRHNKVHIHGAIYHIDKGNIELLSK
ncbi:carbonic anhydrase [Emticicia sp. ODNR4P]|nr:carbonic anhydrase [Emticicia sp. ODNR4P]